MFEVQKLRAGLEIPENWDLSQGITLLCECGMFLLSGRCIRLRWLRKLNKLDGFSSMSIFMLMSRFSWLNILGWFVRMWYMTGQFSDHVNDWSRPCSTFLFLRSPLGVSFGPPDLQEGCQLMAYGIKAGMNMTLRNGWSFWEFTRIYCIGLAIRRASILFDSNGFLKAKSYRIKAQKYHHNINRLQLYYNIEMDM